MEIIGICGRSRDFGAQTTGTATLKVKDARHRISAPHGLSHHERDLLTEGLDYMRQRGASAFVSVEAGRSTDTEKIVRDLTRKLKSVVAQHQRRAGMRRATFVTVFEAFGRDKKPKFGAHIIALMPNVAARDKLVDSLNASTKVYAQQVLAEPVTDWPGLTGYLLKESTPQAWYGRSFRRVGGSIALGELGGDRVVLSNDLKETLLRSGRIEPYKRTYAKRRPKVSTQPVTRPVAPNKYRESLFDGVSLPAIIAAQAARKREKIPPPSLPMEYPPTIADLLDETSNVIVGRFGVSRAVVQRVLELSRAA